MCRIAAYLGPEISLGRFLLQPEHSLVVQSWAPRELRFAKLNADGFGFGWYKPEGDPACYLNALPIWSDVNLDALGDTLHQPLWLASVRSATPGFSTGLANTQPFLSRELLYTHNGFMRNFEKRIRPRLLQSLHPDILAGIQGNTDSEYLFAMLRQTFFENEDLSLESAIAEVLGQIDELMGEDSALLNLVITDGQRIYAARHAVNGECPSLYYTTDDEFFPEGAQLVASEPLTGASFWQSIPEHHVLILDPAEPPELLAL
jgi:gamma-glutamyl hercynylcysteine S-oxide hydrolase